MDRKMERSGKDKVLRRLANTLQQLGFSRTKPTYFTRVKEYYVEFGHIHKFTFGPYFRVHLGIRLLNDKSDSIALNGPDSDSIKNRLFLLTESRKYNFEYNESEKSIDKCVKDIFRFWKNFGVAWFKKWENPQKLVESKKSPLSSEGKKLLTLLIENRHTSMEATSMEMTEKLLGLRKDLKSKLKNK